MGSLTRRARRQKKRLVPAGHRVGLRNPESEDFEEHVRRNAEHCERVAVAGSGVGKSLAICGAGPSLNETAGDYVDAVDEVWGTNSAAVWLHDQGHRVTHAFTIDQTPAMVEEWASPPPLDYLLASTVHPDLTAHLLAHDRRITWFHNFVGIDGPVMRSGDKATTYEQWLYERKYPKTVRTGSGLNAVTRAIDLAMFMGYRPIHVLGADCALRCRTPMPDVKYGTPEHHEWLENEVVMHADGSSPLRSGATDVTLGGKIDGRHWESKSDLWITAVWLVDMAHAIPHLNLVGDTLPNALMDKPDEFLRELPRLTRPDGTAAYFNIDDQTAYWNYDD